MKNKDAKEKIFFKPINFSIASIILLFSAILVASISEFNTYVRVTLLISSGVLCVLQIVLLNREKHTIHELLETSTKAINTSKEMSAIADAFSKQNNEIVEFLFKPYSHEALKNLYLSIETIYIHYVDENRINGYYRDVIGPVIPSKITLEQGLSVDHVSAISTSLSLSKTVSAGIEASNEESKTKSIINTQEGKYVDESINKKILVWQSSLIQNDKIHIGSELCKLETEKNEVSIENKKSQEKLRQELVSLMSLNGFVLIKGLFRLTIEKENSSCYELFLEHQINQLFEEANIFFKISVPKADISNIVFENSYSDKKQLQAIVIGYITPNQFDGDLSNQPSFINVLPIAVYSTPTQPSEIELQKDYKKVINREFHKLKEQEAYLIAKKKGLLALIAEKNGIISELEAIIAEKRAMIAEKEAMIAEKEAAINKKQNTK